MHKMASREEDRSHSQRSLHTDSSSTPKPFQGRINMTASEKDELKQQAHEMIGHMLREEIDFRVRGHAQLDDSKWRLIKTRDRLKAFKRIRNFDELQGKQRTPVSLAIGYIDGSLDEVMYGMHHKNDEEIQIKSRFMDPACMDAAELVTLEGPTDDDPFCYMAITWRIYKMPLGNLIADRDMLVLEYQGTAYDEQDERYGFQMIQSIEVSWFPELPEKSVIRAQVVNCCIYRDTDRGVHLFNKSKFSLGGKLTGELGFAASSAGVLNLTKCLDCCNVKRLTLWMQIEQRKRRPSLASTVLASEELMMIAGRQHSLPPDDIAGLTASGSPDICGICGKRKHLLSRFDHCRICLRTVCSRCQEKRLIFARPHHLHIACCRICICESRKLRADPRDPFPILNCASAPFLATTAPLTPGVIP